MIIQTMFSLGTQKITCMVWVLFVHISSLQWIWPENCLSSILHWKVTFYIVSREFGVFSSKIILSYRIWVNLFLGKHGNCELFENKKGKLIKWENLAPKNFAALSHIS